MRYLGAMIGGIAALSLMLAILILGRGFFVTDSAPAPRIDEPDDKTAQDLQRGNNKTGVAKAVIVEDILSQEDQEMVLVEEEIVEIVAENTDDNLRLDAEIDWGIKSQELADRADIWSFERDISEFIDEDSLRRVLPEGMRFVLAETVDYRLDVIDLEGLPEEVELAIWPDSALTVAGRPFFLINPPSDIMELYYVQSVVEDGFDFYYDAMKKARGVFLRGDEEMLISDRPIGDLFLQSMVDQNKSLVIRETEITPEIAGKIAQLKLEYLDIDQVLDGQNLEDDWSRVMETARHGAEVSVLLEARGESVEAIKAILQKEKDAQLESLENAEEATKNF